MNIGMLWFDDTPREMAVKIQQAAAYYRQKYGQVPNLCFVHPSMLAADALKLNGVAVRPAQTVLPGHFWLGVEQTAPQPKQG
ncbi:MAG: hypothetical protein Fur0018_02640 [Anaerolineales bacterium]